MIQELRDIKIMLKKDIEKGSDYFCQVISPGMWICKRYDGLSPGKQTLNQTDIDSNTNNTLK